VVSSDLGFEVRIEPGSLPFYPPPPTLSNWAGSSSLPTDETPTPCNLGSTDTSLFCHIGIGYCSDTGYYTYLLIFELKKKKKLQTWEGYLRILERYLSHAPQTPFTLCTLTSGRCSRSPLPVLQLHPAPMKRRTTLTSQFSCSYIYWSPLAFSLHGSTPPAIYFISKFHPSPSRSTMASGSTLPLHRFG
jgi:hypothetical protein